MLYLASDHKARAKHNIKHGNYSDHKDDGIHLYNFTLEDMLQDAIIASASVNLFKFIMYLS